MNRKLNAQDIVGEIEFELAHSSLSQDELGQGIQAVRQYQNQVRAEVFGLRGNPDPRELARRQFQLNDMLLAVLHQMSLNLRASQVEQRQLAEWVRSHTTGLTDLPAPSPSPSQTVQPPNLAALPPSNTTRPDDDLLLEIQNILRSSKLWLDPDVRPVRVPIIGGLLTRLRAALHDVSLFYTNRLGARQTAINQALCDAILRLAEEQQQLAHARRVDVEDGK
jgi:hypothetical protein